MKKIKVIIIDDERLAREEMKRHLQDYFDFEIAREAENADEAEVMIHRMNPDLIFLDIQMPGRSGLDLLESLDNVPQIIFTTAFDHYAVQAFDISAMDYLVKPVRKERFVKALEKIRTKFTEKENGTKTPYASHTIFVKEGERFYWIKVREIHLIESTGNYVRLHFCNQKVLVKRSLNQLEKALDAMLFFRINRTEIINEKFIRQIRPLPNGRLGVSLQTGGELVVSVRQSAALKKRRLV